ncbi:MAG: Rrf2 family transcriptional regulator [Clostridia bacterium]|jgi:Rrf2 family protein|nr:Rrf2 family transcriptional regulator [Clostridia bacterium]MDD3972643.1 Rrf2 family transcriptional regulator [Clostridia bacterium]NLF35788.1 Rrf2 family transcriptional regulator [Clostridiaceae bacterium]HXK72449.1 Rrf2 family transcriptional regulator [Clostridia bacterium]
MKISTKGRYALRIMIELAQNKNDKPISLKQISQKQDISAKYLESIISILNKHNFVFSTRGINGGYVLSKEPSEYTIGSILRVTEGSLSPVNCLECQPNRCIRSADCLTLPLWQNIGKMINDYLDSITLEDILNKNINKSI